MMTIKELILKLQEVEDQDKQVSFIIDNTKIELYDEITIFDGEPIIDKDADYCFISVYN